MIGARRAWLCAPLAVALAGCGSGTVTRTESGPPHVTSVTVPVTVPSPSVAGSPSSTAAEQPAPPVEPAQPPGHAKEHKKKQGKHGGGGD
jgi:hypothetical protein